MVDTDRAAEGGHAPRVLGVEDQELAAVGDVELVAVPAPYAEKSARGAMVSRYVLTVSVGSGASAEAAAAG
ncbi:hypothetical protein [Streptomyces sparsogenes]|uniref:Uncharacterized protein n=1 Tax=Streptomyces sparsogenes DSM 40356 TaxID=1331668 RepID=A0A1R1SE23_9ACTN|nr:hypothetical protein [Streptomyces sparsogenes]OMI36299.1 hypothetical protein SPAR_26961 [Streptomyces sparsogenes DSM 40356]